MPARRCVAQDCSNTANLRDGISLHNSPANKVMRAKWVKFVKLHRKNFTPEGGFGICSIHFEGSCFTRPFHVEGSRRTLIPGSVPTIWKLRDDSEAPVMSARDRRMAIKDVVTNNGKNDNAEFAERDHPAEVVADLNISDTENNREPFSTNENASETVADIDEQPSNSSIDVQEQTDDDPLNVNTITRPELDTEMEPSGPNCVNCGKNAEEKKALKKTINILKTKIKRQQERLDRKTKELTNIIPRLSRKSVGIQTVCDESCPDIDMDLEEEEASDEEGVQDPEWNLKKKESQPPSQEQNDEEYNSLGEDDIDGNSNPRLDFESKSEQEEPKGIVFLSKLMLLFKFCHMCFAPDPKVNVSQYGTMLQIDSICKKCSYAMNWRSQPLLRNKFPAGNLLLSFAILCAGASVKKVLLVFQHMNLLVYQEATYYYHQRHLLIPSIVKFWRSYQSGLLNSLNGKEVILAGDGRHDSMGHSAKFGTYTIYCCTLGLIIHLVVVQANEAGSSSAMEFLGHQRAFEFLLTTGMIITTFVSDRHASIAKWMREELPGRCRVLGKPVVNHFFDLWHIGKKIQKTLIKLSKEQGCEIIGRWRKACVRHFYWSVTSTQSLLGNVKVAKFHSFLSHVLNVHKNLPIPLFNACNHGPITKMKVWMTKGSEAYGKLFEALTKAKLTKAIKKASSVGQTSCLEGYHSVINQFAPKMLSFSYLGMLGRTILAALHFNYNVKRLPKIGDDGKPKLQVYYPKFKYGEATVRERKVTQNFDYVNELFLTLKTTPRTELKLLERELKESTPEPMYSMLERECKEEATAKYLARKDKETVICPPTCTDAELQKMLQQAVETAAPRTRQGRQAPSCRKCGNPMKGHKRGKCQQVSN